jgi:hypothetical protein
MKEEDRRRRVVLFVVALPFLSRAVALSQVAVTPLVEVQTESAQSRVRWLVTETWG